MSSKREKKRKTKLKSGSWAPSPAANSNAGKLHRSCAFQPTVLAVAAASPSPAPPDFPLPAVFHSTLLAFSSRCCFPTEENDLLFEAGNLSFEKISEKKSCEM